MFACTSRTGPVSIPVGYLGGADAYTNAEALGNLHLFPYYRVKNSKPDLQRRAAVRFRTNAAFGMKPVSYSFVPTWLSGSTVFASDQTKPFPPTATDWITRESYRRRRSGFIPFGNYRQPDHYDPTYGATAAQGGPQPENVLTSYYGVTVCTRPGSWTMNSFPGLVCYARVTLRFYKRKTLPVENAQFANIKSDFKQLAFGVPMYGF